MHRKIKILLFLVSAFGASFAQADQQLEKKTITISNGKAIELPVASGGVLMAEENEDVKISLALPTADGETRMQWWVKGVISGFQPPVQIVISDVTDPVEKEIYSAKEPRFRARGPTRWNDLDWQILTSSFEITREETPWFFSNVPVQRVFKIFLELGNQWSGTKKVTLYQPVTILPPSIRNEKKGQSNP